MAHSIEIDSQIPQLLQTEINEIDGGNKYEIRIINDMIHNIFNYLDNSSTESHTIFKVNVGIRESNPDAYTPKMISIGPYHKKQSHRVDPMEKHKLLYLRRFLQRKEGLDVNNCIRELYKVKEEALKCYENSNSLDDDYFFKILFLDGCFVVEFIRECCEMCPEGEATIISNDLASYIFRDLMLLENQLPFFVINKLHSMTKHVNESSLVGLVNDVCIYFSPMIKRSSFGKTECCNNVGNIKHLLQLFHILSCRKTNPSKKSKIYIPYNNKVMPNATELSEAGVSFANVDDMETSLFDIKFDESTGLMTIPCFQVDDDTETILRNLIAYEQQSSVERPKYFSDYAALMDHLIDSEKDVNLLRQKGIILNFMGDDKNVANLFNKIEYGVVTMYRNFYYVEELEQAIKYSEKPWNRMRANLKHNYFSSPWIGASTVAAIILLILTTTQTILAFTGSINK